MGHGINTQFSLYPQSIQKKGQHRTRAVNQMAAKLITVCNTETAELFCESSKPSVNNVSVLTEQRGQTTFTDI